MILSVENLSKTFGQQQRERSGAFALKDVSFELEEGDVLGVIGRNGSGKSTLLKLLAGIIKQDVGVIKYNGRLVSIIDIGSGFHPDLNGLDNIFFYGNMLGIRNAEIRKHLDEIIAFSELQDHLNKEIKFYSSGMYLRLAFAVIFSLKTDIMILDEVISVGDTQFMMKCNKRIQELLDKGHSIILSSHYMGDISRLCDKCIWLDGGKIRMYGESNDVVSAYLSEIRYKDSFYKPKASFYRWSEATRPSFEGFSLHGVRLILPFEQSAAADYNEPIIVEIEYHQDALDRNVSFSISVVDQYGNIVLTSSPYFDSDRSAIQNHAGAGMYKCVCLLRAQMLNIGVYSLNIRVHRDIDYTVFNLAGIINFEMKCAQREQERLLLLNPLSNAVVGSWKFLKLSD